MTIRVLIVDDEPLARERIRTLLADVPDVEIAGECRDGRSAVEAIRRTRPDLVFLDVQMPEMDGFEVLETIGDRRPAVIFVTAFDRYALRAFDVHSLDYLLKPFDQERFERALERARSDFRLGRLEERGERLLALLEGVAARQGHRRRLAVRTGGRVTFVQVEEVDRIEAQGNYVMLHCGGTQHLLRETMKGLAPRLDPDRFARIHRSHIVNLDRVAALSPRPHGEYLVTMTDGTEVLCSRGYASSLRRVLDGDA